MSASPKMARAAQRVLNSYPSRNFPVRDFLAPALFTPSARRRLLSTTASCSATLAAGRTPTPNTPPAAASPNSQKHDSVTTSHSAQSKPGGGKRKPLTKAQREFLSSALRVNQTGELAAVNLFSAQMPIVVRRQPAMRGTMKHMLDQEAGHLDTWNALISRHRVRPTAMYPVWTALSYGLGWTTAVMGREAAMACHEAVETEIGDHYNEQIRRLLVMVAEWEAEGYDVGAEFRELLGTVRRIRDEELEHLDIAVANDAKEADPHWLLTGVIRAGCRGAIWVSEKV